MLLALALFAQDIPLNAPATEAVKCAQGLAGTLEDSPDQARVLVQAFYFMMRAAEADPGTDGKNFLDRTTEISADLFARRPLRDANLLKQCDARYPLSRRTTAAQLPAPGFDRDLMCLSVSSLLTGILQGANANGGNGTLPDLDLDGVIGGYTKRIPNSLLDQRNIVTDEQVNSAMAGSLRASLGFGNLEAVARACAAAL